MNNSNNDIFWFNNNYLILFNNYDLLPNSNMTWEGKLNSITRLIILLSVICFLITKNKNIIIVGLICILLIILSYKYNFKENYINVSTSSNKLKKNNNSNSIPLKSILKKDFYQNNKSNPFGNVLLPEINSNPNRKPAPPSFNLDVEKDNTNNVKEAIQSLNPDIIDTNKQLFGDIYQNFELDQSNRIFYSNANTKVTNDQGAFAEFLYGNMPSAKEGNQFALLQDNYRYILY
jgi:hypothetical protein